MTRAENILEVEKSSPYSLIDREMSRSTQGEVSVSKKTEKADKDVASAEGKVVKILQSLSSEYRNLGFLDSGAGLDILLSNVKKKIK